MFDTSQFTYALVTSTTYGTWLPGDERGYVNEEKNQFGAPFFHEHPGLKLSAQNTMNTDTVWFQQQHAEAILARWLEIAKEYGWRLYAVAIMPNHFHIAVAAPGKVTKETFLRNFKSRASKRLNNLFGKKTWWTTSGSVRFCFVESSLRARIEYVKNQENPLLIWVNPEGLE